MDYEEFLQTVKNEMTTDFSVYHAGQYDDLKIEIKDVEKLQGSYRGLSIGKEGDSIQVCMDMREHFKMYQNGTPLDRIIFEAEQSAIRALDDRENIPIVNFTNYEIVKPMLTMQVIGREGNEELLREMPHKDMGDLATVYRIELQHSEQGTSSVTIMNHLLEKLGVTAEQLHEDALEMAQKTHPAELVPLGVMMQQMMGGAELPVEAPEVYVATNPQKFMGASVMNYPGFMEQASEQLGGDFFILPSSVHELLFLPAKDGPDLDHLKGMVREVNDSQVEPKDRLSYQVYYYSKEEKTIELADKAVQRKLEKEKKTPEKESSVLSKLENRKKEVAKNPPVPGKVKGEAVMA